MEAPSVRWLSALEMEDPTFLYQCDLGSLDQPTNQQIAVALGETFGYETSESFTSYQNLNTRSQKAFGCSSMESSHGNLERQAKHPKRTVESHSPSPNVISFCNQSSSNDRPQLYDAYMAETAKMKDNKKTEDVFMPQSSLINQGYVLKTVQGGKRGSNGTPAKPTSHPQDHIIAERKRREKLNQRFIALSAIVPGLRKMDKASVLGDALKYMKQLQEKVKTLEDQSVKKTVESVVFIKKSHLPIEDDISSTDENFEGRSDKPLLEIEARVSEKKILLRIHCEKRKGILLKTLGEIEKFQLSIVNANILPFTSALLDITVIAQMEDEFCLDVKDLVKNLRSAILGFM